MKKTITSFLVLIALNIIGLQAQTLPEEDKFYKKIQGLYQDFKTSEVVFIYAYIEKPDMFYQPTPYCSNAQIKVMKETSTNVNKNQLNIRFMNSNYRCTFIFGRRYRSFICINPDGSRQTFRRVNQVIHRNFSYFLSFFPTHPTSQYQASPRSPSGKKLPIQVAWKFISQQHLDSSSSDVQIYSHASLHSFYSSLPSAPYHTYGYNAYYALKRLSLHPDFYTLVIREAGQVSGGEARGYIISLYNFSKQGRLIDQVQIGGWNSDMGHITEYWGKVKGKHISLQQKELGGGYGEPKTPKTNTSEYMLLPSGKFKQRK